MDNNRRKEEDEEDVIVDAEVRPQPDIKKAKKKEKTERSSDIEEAPAEDDLMMDDDGIPANSERSRRSSASSTKKSKVAKPATEPGAVPHSPPRKPRRQHQTEDDGEDGDALPPPRRESSSRKPKKKKKKRSSSATEETAQEPSMDVLDVVRSGGAVCAVPIDEEAYAQELLEKAKEQEEKEAPVLVHAVKAPTDKSPEEAEAERKERRCRTMIYIAIGAVLLIAAIIGMAVGLSGGGDPEPVVVEVARTFEEFCLTVIGFYVIHEPRLKCDCDPDANKIECQGDYDQFYNGVVIEFNPETGAYAAADCYCDTINCPATSYACYNVFSQDECLITEGFLAGETLCNGGCSYCDDDEDYFSFSLATCDNVTGSCSRTVIPKPAFLADSVDANRNPTPSLTQPSSFRDFCEATNSTYHNLGYACECTEDYDEVTNNQGENLQTILCTNTEDHAVMWVLEENSVIGGHCECIYNCDGPQRCTVVQHDYVSGHAICFTSDFAAGDDGTLCDKSECTVCEGREGESFFRVDTSACDGSDPCAATDMFF